MANKIDSALDRLVDDLRAAYGENLASIVLYGSVAAGDHVELRSDHNLLIVLKRIALEDLRLSQTTIRNWLTLGQPFPVYFTPGELKRPVIVFPMDSVKRDRPRKTCSGGA